MIDKESEKILWRDAVIVFDTCALGDIYALSTDTQVDFVDILKLLKDRIWIPSCVQKEFDNHHDEFRYAPIVERYSRLREIVEQGNQYKKDLTEGISKLDDATSHPYLDVDAYEEISAISKQITQGIERFQTIIHEQRNKRKAEIKATAQLGDSLYTLLPELEHGRALSRKELIEIAQEGHARYECLIPPGFEDLKKPGIAKYGDLIIWKEIIRCAKEKQKPIIFISDDCKPDWDAQIEGKSAGEPRPELVAEFQEETGLLFWKYTLEQMIEKLKEYYSSRELTLKLYSLLDDVKYQLQLVNDFKKALDKDKNCMLLKCKSCGREFEVAESELYLEWEPKETTERPMGAEHEFFATETIECPHCGRASDVEMRVWEYPEGIINEQSIEATNAEVLREMDLSKASKSFDTHIGYCEECGAYRYIHPNKFGLCDDCYDRKWKEFMED